MISLGRGLFEANLHEDELSIREAQLSMERRLGASETNILIVQGHLAMTYSALERYEEALRMRYDVYYGRLKLNGEEHRETLAAASSCALSLACLQRFEKAKPLLRKTMPVARRVLGESDDVTLAMRTNYASALYRDPSATLDDLSEAVATLEDLEQAARRVMGGAHPLTSTIERHLGLARSAAAPPSPEDELDELEDV